MEERVKRLRKSHEGPSEWRLRELFLRRNMNKGISSDRLECLSNCFAYSVMYGVRYPQPVMDEVKTLSIGIVDEAFPKGLPSFRGPSDEEALSKPATVDSSKSEAPTNHPKFSSIQDCDDRKWLTSKNCQTILRLAGPKFCPIFFVKASLSESEDPDSGETNKDQEQARCFPKLSLGDMLEECKPKKTDTVTSTVPTGLPKVVITLQKLFEAWKNLSEPSYVGSFHTAASKTHTPLSFVVAPQNSQSGNGGFTCTLTITDPLTGKTVILSEASSRNKKETKQLACKSLLDFRDRQIGLEDIKIDPNNAECCRLIHNRDAVKEDTPGNRVGTKEKPNSGSVITLMKEKCPIPDPPPSDQYPGKMKKLGSSTTHKTSVPRKTERAMPKFVFLKEVMSDSSGPMQILVTTADTHSLELQVDTLPNNSYCLRFLGQVWGPLAGVPLIKAKRLLAEAALNDLRQELWTLRIRKMPDFSALQEVVGVEKTTAVKSSEGMQFEDVPLDGKNVGHKLLLQMGWNKSKGLGKDEEGRRVPVSADMTLVRRQGLGHKSDDSSAISIRGFIIAQLREFSDAGVNAEDLCFSSEFTNQERAQIHQQCRKFPKLESKSFNTADGNRFLVVMRKRKPRELLNWVIGKGCRTVRYEAFQPGMHPDLI